MNSPLLARPAYGSFVLCSRDESGTASRTKPFIGNSWRYFSELCSVLDTTFIGAMHRIGVETSLVIKICIKMQRPALADQNSINITNLADTLSLDIWNAVIKNVSTVSFGEKESLAGGQIRINRIHSRKKLRRYKKR